MGIRCALQCHGPGNLYVPNAQHQVRRRAGYKVVVRECSLNGCDRFVATTSERSYKTGPCDRMDCCERHAYAPSSAFSILCDQESDISHIPAISLLHSRQYTGQQATLPDFLPLCSITTKERFNLMDEAFHYTLQSSNQRYACVEAQA